MKAAMVAAPCQRFERKDKNHILVATTVDAFTVRVKPELLFVTASTKVFATAVVDELASLNIRLAFTTTDPWLLKDDYDHDYHYYCCCCCCCCCCCE